MKEIGHLEETILLLVMTMNGKAYGFVISEAYQQYMGKSISISAVHAVLSRLEKKGLLKSEMGQATAERGGRRKRLFEATVKGEQAIETIKAIRQKLWSKIPRLS